MWSLQSSCQIHAHTHIDVEWMFVNVDCKSMICQMGFKSNLPLLNTVNKLPIAIITSVIAILFVCVLFWATLQQ